MLFKETFDKEINPKGETVISFPITGGMKFLTGLILFLISMIIFLGLALSITGLVEQHSLFLMILGLILAVIGVRGILKILPLRNPVQIVLSQLGITIHRGPETYTAPWKSLGPFEWDDKQLCLRAKAVGPGIIGGLAGEYFVVPPSANKEDVPALLAELKSFQ
jgi:hypothetical protein